MNIIYWHSELCAFQSFSSLISLPSQFCVCNSHKSRKLAQGKFAVRQGKRREFENAF